MLLVADIGNTQTVIGVYDICSEADPAAAWRISTEKRATADDIKSKLHSLFGIAGIDASSISHAAFASVVPSLSDEWARLIEDVFGVEPIKCSAKSASEYGLFSADYPNPSEIGADRVADAIAIRYLYGSPAIVVDFGTATNIEVLDSSGSFVGGVIAPGIMTGADALFSHATRLAAIDFDSVGPVVGKSTDQAVCSGIIYGEAARVDGLLRRIIAEQGFTSGKDGAACSVVATGGLAGLVAEYSEMITDVRPDLTLVGLRLLAEKELC